VQPSGEGCSGHRKGWWIIAIVAAVGVRVCLLGVFVGRSLCVSCAP
jgi:hypothetical protein